MTTLIKATIAIDTKVRTTSQRRQSEMREKRHVKEIAKKTKQRLYLLIFLVSVFVLFWYPLFFVTASDPTFRVSPFAYKSLTMFAWTNPAVTPFVLFFFIKTKCCCQDEEEDTTHNPHFEEEEDEEHLAANQLQEDGHVQVSSDNNSYHDYPANEDEHQLEEVTSHSQEDSLSDAQGQQLTNHRKKSKKSKHVSLWI